MKKYLIKIKCIKCDRCLHTGWRLISSTNEKKKTKELLKYWKRFFGAQGKNIKLFKNI